MAALARSALVCVSLIFGLTGCTVSPSPQFTSPAMNGGGSDGGGGGGSGGNGM